MTKPLRALLPALLLLSACNVKFENTPHENWNKPGVSQAQKKTDVERCEYAFQSAGGAVAKNASMQQSRTQACLQKRGYSRRPEVGGR